jgi:hypothetical protein
VQRVSRLGKLRRQLGFVDGTQPVLITNCWAFRAATNVWGPNNTQFNGNGFKLGVNGTATPHRLVHGLSFGNSASPCRADSFRRLKVSDCF